MIENETPAWGNRLYRHFRMENGRLIGYWATISRVRLDSIDFGKVFG